MTQVSFSRVTCIPTLLFIGNEESGKDTEILDSLAISNIITLIGQRDFPHKYKYFNMSIDDSPCEDIYRFFNDTYEFIDTAESSTLVQGGAGISRAATIVLAYIMKKLHISLADAVHLLKIDMPQIDPNAGFMMQLRIYQRVLGIPDTLQSSQPVSDEKPLFVSGPLKIYGPELLYNLEFKSGVFKGLPVTVYTRFALPEFDTFQMVTVAGGFVSLISDNRIQLDKPQIICVTDKYIGGVLAYNVISRKNSELTYDEIKKIIDSSWPEIAINNTYTLRAIQCYINRDLNNIKTESLIFINHLRRMINVTNPAQMYSILNALNNMNTFNITEIEDARDSVRALLVNCIDAIAAPSENADFSSIDKNPS